MRRMLGLMTVCGVLAAACGAKVTVDTTAGSSANASGGAGGVSGGTAVGGSTGTGVHGSGSGGASCFNPPDPATLTFCTAGVSTGTGTTQCENDFCDAKGNTWAAKCTSNACLCTFNDNELCTCALNGPGNFCDATPSCCPLPGSK